MKRKKISFIVSLSFLALVVIAFTQRMAIFDAWRLYNYEAPSEVSMLADSTSMKDNSRRLFYVYHPQILDKDVFNVYCRDGEMTIVLGCYRSGKGIYIYDVEDPRLNGIKEVTAAHEVLHAAYERLSSKERAKIDDLTSKALETITDERILSTVKLYRDKDASSLPNELHSILGTEVRVLPAELEAHYAKYFIDRSKVVALSEQYEKAFTDRKNQIAAYDSQLKALNSQIDALKENLEQEEKALAQDRASVERSQSPSQISAYNARVNRFNNNIKTVKGLIDQYNNLLEKRNALVLEEQDLVKAIDSRDVVPVEQ